MAKEDKKADDTRTKNIKNAQDRKDFAIAFFNATNNAIEMVKSGVYFTDKSGSSQDRIIEWRDWFLEQHLEYRAKVTEKIGATYNVGTAIEKLEATTNREELKSAWLSLSQDERQDPEIAKRCQELVEKYETIQRD